MGIREKHAGEIVSYAATGISLIIAGWLAVKGVNRPTEYTASMAINHHSSYGGAQLTCRQCHSAPKTPISFGSMVTCVTSKCHGALQDGVSQSDALEIRRLELQHLSFMADFEEKSIAFLEMHAMVETMSCTDCHKEHQKYEAPLPDGWEEFQKQKRQVSLNDLDSHSVTSSLDHGLNQDMFQSWLNEKPAEDI